MREIKTATIQDGDQSIVIECQQMGAYSLEKWVTKVALLVAGTGIANSFDVDEFNTGAGALSAVSSMLLKDGFKALANVDEVKFNALHDEILKTCKLVKDGGVKLELTPTVIDANFNDYKTVFKIIGFALETNLNFSLSTKALSSTSEPSETATESGKSRKILVH